MPVDPQHHDLLIDGYLSHMFGPRDAESYHVSLLGRKSQLIQWHVTLPEGIFVAASRAGQEPNQEETWAIDYAIRDAGVVIPQQIWAPRNPSDAQRYVNHELHPPIFFALRDGQRLGLSLIDAAAGNCMYLRGAEQVASSVGRSSHVQIRINWRGYRHLECSEQIMTQKGSPPRETISLEKFAKYVAGRVLKFMETAKSHAYHDDDDPSQRCQWLIADHHITPDDVILIGAVQVSQGSWMPILQVNDGFALSVGN